MINHPNLTLLNEDNMPYLRNLPDKCFDIACLDTAYGINAPNMKMVSNPNMSGRDSRGEIQYGSTSTAEKLKKGRLNSGGGKLKDRFLNKSDISWDDQPPTQEFWDHIFRISKNQIIWGANYFPLPPTRGMFCWNKNQPWDNFSQFELAWTSFDIPARLFTFSNRGGSNEEQKIHPTQKPVECYMELIKNYIKAGDSIIDTNSGSNSLAIAVLKANMLNDMNLKLTSIEIDKTYFDAAGNRIDKFLKEHSPASEQPLTADNQYKLI